MSDWNEINGSQSALGEGSFKRRDELRRAENLQRNKVKMGERLDRNISRAVRKGDAQSAQAFVRTRQAITGQSFGGEGGITNRDDREQRVRDGAIKGARARYDIGNIGANQEDAYSGAPPEDSVTPKNRQESVNPSATVGTRGRSLKGRDSEGQSLQSSGSERPVEGTGLTPDSPKSSSSGGEWVDVSGRGQGGVGNESVAPRSQTPQGGLESNRAAVARLKSQWASNDPNLMQKEYESKNGDPADQAQPYREEFGQSDGKVDKAIAGLDPSKFSPEQIASIKKNMQSLTPQQRKDSVAEGKVKGDAWGAKADKVIDRAKSTVSSVGLEIENRKNQGKSLQNEISEIRKSNQEILNGSNRPKITESQNKPVDNTGPITQPNESVVTQTAPSNTQSIRPPTVKDDLAWLKPGVSPYQAKQSLTEVSGYSSDQADALIKGRGVTVDGMKIKADKDKLNRSQIQASINRTAANEFSEGVRNNPPIAPKWMQGSVAEKVYLSLRGHDKAKIKEYERQQREAAIARLQAPPKLPPT